MAKAKYFVGQDEVDFPPGTQFKTGIKGETYIVLPPYTCIEGPSEGAEIYLEDDSCLMVQTGAVLENVIVRGFDAKDTD